MALESVTTTTTVSTVPSGTKIAADALAGGEVVQYVKIIDGTANGETPIAGDANGLDVDVTRLPTLVAGTAIIGKVGIDQTTPGTTNLVSLAANQSVNVAQMNGVATTMGAGNSGTGVQRVIIATDQPALTNKLLVTPDSVALPANQSVNVSQINAVTPLMGAGNTGTGSLRVTIATDQTQLTNALKVDPSAVTSPVSVAAAAASIGKAEDAAHVTADVGVPAWGVHRSALTSAPNADGDYTPLDVNDNGQLRVEAGGKVVTVTSNPTLSSGASIVAGDFVGVNATPWSWAGAVRTGPLSGTITTIVVADQSLQAIPMELWLFNATVTVPNDSAAFNLSDADSFKCIGVVDLSSWRSGTLNSVCTVSGLGLDVVLAATTLYGALVARGTATFGTTALQVSITIRQD